MELTSPESLNIALGRRHEASCLRRIEFLEDSLTEARMELSGVRYRYGLKRKVSERGHRQPEQPRQPGRQRHPCGEGQEDLGEGH